MSETAHHFKIHQYFYDQNDKKVYYILEKEESHKEGGHKVKFAVQDFQNFKHTTKTYSHDHYLRLVDVSTVHYTLSHTREEDGQLYLELFDSGMNPRSDFHLDDPLLVRQVQELEENKSDNQKPINVKIVQVKVGKLHRDDKSLELERVVGISGVDFSHLHDHNHHHHHRHATY